MKKVLGACSVIAMFIALMANPAAAQYADTVKIMTYNINAEGHGSGSYSDIATVIKAIDPTICGVQKVDSCDSRNSQYVLKYLGDEASMFSTFAAAQPNYGGNPGSYGIGFLSDKEPKSARRLSIPKGSASEDRAALEIGVTIAGERVRVIVTHLDYANATNRTAQIQKIIPWIDSGAAATIPAIIMADFNAQSTESSLKLLTDAGFTFVKGLNGVILDSTQKINHILYRPESRWKVIDAGNPVYTASNRNPLWALLSLLNPVGIITSKPENAGTIAKPRINSGDKEICCLLPSQAVVTMRLYDPSGRIVRTLISGRLLEAGRHSFILGNAGLTQGTYFLESSINGVKAFERISIIPR
jgi:endonuclease/exonuclease/phosphatase family metal-dependent hydrolase